MLGGCGSSIIDLIINPRLKVLDWGEETVDFGRSWAERESFATLQRECEDIFALQDPRKVFVYGSLSLSLSTGGF